MTAKFFLDSIVTNNNALADYEKYYDEIHSITYAETDPFTVPKDKENLNHASIQTTMRYAHTMREQEISAVEALANFG